MYWFRFHGALSAPIASMQRCGPDALETPKANASIGGGRGVCQDDVRSMWQECDWSEHMSGRKSYDVRVPERRRDLRGHSFGDKSRQRETIEDDRNAPLCIWIFDMCY